MVRFTKTHPDMDFSPRWNFFFPSVNQQVLGVSISQWLADGNQAHRALHFIYDGCLLFNETFRDFV